MEFISFFERHRILKIFLVWVINILAFIGKSLRNISNYNSPQNVIISLHKIGDSVFAFPIVKYLHEKYGENLSVICWENTAEVYSILDFKINLISIRRDEYFLSNRIASKRARKKLKVIKPFKIFDITGNISSATLLWGIRANEIIGRNELYFKNFYDKYIENIEKPHLSDRYFDPIKLIDPCADIDKYRKVISKKLNNDLKILIHPFAGWKAKEWALKRFIELAGKLGITYDVALIFEKNRIGEKIIESLIEHKIKYIETITLNELIKEIKNCSLMIGNDSGPINIANYLGIPTVTIFGPTNPIFHTAFHSKYKVIQNIISCSPKGIAKYCYTNGGRSCPIYECLNSLDSSRVYSEVCEFISNTMAPS